MADFSKMMKQVQKMQNQMAKLQEELAQRELEATSGGGAVRAVANGKKQLLSIEISPEVIDPEDKDMLEDMVVAAVNEVMERVDDMTSEEMKKVTGGLDLPPGLM